MNEPKNKITTKFFFIILDIIFYSILFYYFIRLQYQFYYPTEMKSLSFLQIIKAHFKAYFTSFFFWLLIANTSKIYQLGKRSKYSKILSSIITQILLFIPIIFTISGLKDLPLFQRENILVFCFIIFCYLLFTRLFYRILQLKNEEQRILFIGENKLSLEIKNSLLKNESNKIFVISNSNNTIVNDFQFQIENNKIDTIFISELDLIDHDKIKFILNKCEDHQIEVNLIPASFENNLMTYDLIYINNIQVFKAKRYALDVEENKFLKLIVDKFISLFVCVFIMSWLYPIIALLIKLDSKGPVIFKQKRTGMNGKSFDCYKFRTMKSDGTNSIKATVINDNRITKLGHFLRKTSLDEFPQFFNVLKGDMSIIGPRPHMLNVDKDYENIVNRYYFRYYVKPGITGLSQVKGFRGDMTRENMNDRIRIDIFYIKNWSPYLDFKILIKTFILVFKGDDNAI